MTLKHHIHVSQIFLKEQATLLLDYIFVTTLENGYNLSSFLGNLD